VAWCFVGVGGAAVLTQGMLWAASEVDRRSDERLGGEV